MAQPAEGYGLTWTDHSSDVMGAMRKLRAKSAFCDVSLVFPVPKRDPVVLCAHKVVLCAGSSFFEKVFWNTLSKDKKQEVFLLTDLRVEIVRLMLDFIYNGEVYVEAKDLSEFMAVAEKLEIRGLQAGPEDTQTPEVQMPSLVGKNSRPASGVPGLVKRPRLEEVAVDPNGTGIDLPENHGNSTADSEENQWTLSAVVNEANELSAENSTDGGSSAGVPRVRVVPTDRLMEPRTAAPSVIPVNIVPETVICWAKNPCFWKGTDTLGATAFFCGFCDLIFRSGQHARNHCFARHASITCPHCDMSFTRAYDFKMHCTHVHGQEPPGTSGTS